MFWRLGVIGSPIEHSLSPRLHEAGLSLAGLQGRSERYRMVESDSPRLAAMMGAEVDALSVTMPMKAPAAALCDRLDDRSRELGVVSSLLWRDGLLWGATFDGEGLCDYLLASFAFEVAHAHVVVVGSGGAARAIVAALVSGGAQSVSVLGRNAATVDEIVARHFNVYPEMQLYRPVDLIINTTPAPGRAAESAVMQGVTRDSVAVDITYDPRRSPWLGTYEEFGCRVANGLGMLAYQAARQMNWWWGTHIDGADLLAVIT